MPLRRLAAGLLLVALDLRLGPVDVLPDVLGWLLILDAVRKVGDGDPAARLPSGLALAAGALSLTDLVRVRYASTVYDLCVGAALLVLFTYLAILAARSGDGPAERGWLRLRNVVLFLVAAGVFLSLFGRIGVAPQLKPAYLVVSLAAMATAVVLLLAHATRPWARPAGAARETFPNGDAGP